MPELSRNAAQFPRSLLHPLLCRSPLATPTRLEAGEQGLMQISKDKCGGAPNGNCQDVDFNIRTGTKFFADTLNGNGGNLLLTLGNYNGWPKRMTIVSNH